MSRTYILRGRYGENGTGDPRGSYGYAAVVGSCAVADVMERARRAFERAGGPFEVEKVVEGEHRLILRGSPLCSIVQDYECNSSLHALYAPNNESESRT
jgi:hypothetical protein